MERRPAMSQNDNVNKAVGTKKSPLVQAGKTCPSLCFFKDTVGNQWCINFEAPALVVGWNWEQSASDTEHYWQLKFKPYIKPAFWLKSEWDLKRFYYHYIYVFIEQFTATLFYSFIFHKSGRVCLGMGWELTQIVFQINTKFMFKDCSKVLINDICDWKTTWLGDSAMWLDKCEDKASVPKDLIVRKTEIAPAISQENGGYLLGGVNYNGAGCWQFADWSEWPGWAAETAGNSFIT